MAGPGQPIRRGRVHFTAMVLAGLLAAAAAALTGLWVEAPAIGWSCSALTYTLWVWLDIGRLDPEQTRAHATADDTSHSVADLLILYANVASLAAVAAVVVRSHGPGGIGSGGGLLALTSVALSWMLVQTLFTLHYAQLYYGNAKESGHGGINFNQPDPPQYTDFAYLATSIGMTYQISDTALENHKIRVEALKHSLLSYLFGAVIMATTINVVIGLAV